MRRILAARALAAAACWLLIFVTFAETVGAQQWNDSLTLSLVQRSTARRAQQLADTGLSDYHASAHGYVTFLAQLGERFRTPPKIVKADELQLEVYWRAPNQSKQIIQGRRDTLLLPTDIAYHSDHLGIVQNNFPNIIRIGDGDEVRDVPHPLSAAGLQFYDFALSDSFSIGAGAQRIRVREIKVRPKDDSQPRVVGAVYLDAAEGQVVRMAFSFTRAAFVDQALEELSVVLENRLVNGRFWLPSRQEIEIMRTGTWMDFPARGIIRGRWEIGDYELNRNLPPALFIGPEIVQQAPTALRRFPWKGRVLDSLPPDVRAVTDEDVERVQAEARELVRARALERAQRATVSARSISDFARFDRVEGLAAGAGLRKQVGLGLSATVRGRYGLDDKQGKGTASLDWTRPSGAGIGVFAARDFRDVGDVQERSGALNSLAAQEFGSDYTDPYLVRAFGARVVAGNHLGLDWRITGSSEWQSALDAHAHPVTGRFSPLLAVPDEHFDRLSVEATRRPALWLFGTELSSRIELRGALPTGITTGVGDDGTLRGVLVADVERPFGVHRLATSTVVAGLLATPSDGLIPPQELVYFGGPVSAPGYDFHSLVTRAGFSEHVEWRMPAPFPAFSLGRFGRVPAHGTFAPYAHVVGLRERGLFPSVGAAYLLPFDLMRFDVARGLRDGRWTFGLDVSREFWSIL